MSEHRNALIRILAEIDQKIAEAKELLDGPLDDVTPFAFVALSELQEAQFQAESELRGE
jgi:hypothetical protein